MNSYQSNNGQKQPALKKQKKENAPDIISKSFQWVSKAIDLIISISLELS